VSPAATPPAAAPIAPRALRHRRSARRLTSGQASDLRKAITKAQGISDDRGYQYWAGIHGWPPPEWCQHGTSLFLPWHRAYLYLFEKQLQDRVPGVTLPWWDWTQNHGEGIPVLYSSAEADGGPNPLASSPIQESGRVHPDETITKRAPHATRLLPSPDRAKEVLDNRDFFTFQTQLEEIHGAVHMWVGRTMHLIETAAYDPLFWAHHCMIDRLWYLWQLDHPGAGLSERYLDQALPPFPMTVRQTLSITDLGYDYAAATAAVNGPGHG
jgi:tyrosinase